MDKMSDATRELRKDCINEDRLPSSTYTHLETIQAAAATPKNPNTPTPFATPMSIPVHLLLYHTLLLKSLYPEISMESKE